MYPNGRPLLRGSSSNQTCIATRANLVKRTTSLGLSGTIPKAIKDNRGRPNGSTHAANCRLPTIRSSSLELVFRNFRIFQMAISFMKFHLRSFTKFHKISQNFTKFQSENKYRQPKKNTLIMQIKLSLLWSLLPPELKIVHFFKT